MSVKPVIIRPHFLLIAYLAMLTAFSTSQAHADVILQQQSRIAPHNSPGDTSTALASNLTNYTPAIVQYDVKPMHAKIQTATSIEQETHSDKPMQFQNGVSALDYFNLSPHRTHAGVTPITGPSEHELRLIFLRVVETALARSPEILRFQAERDAAGSDVDEAKGQRWPQIDIGTQSSGIAFGGGTKNTRDGAGINVAISTMLFDWGRIDKTINSRKRLADAADDSIAAQIEDTSFEVVSTLIELGKQRLIAERSQGFVDRMNELVKMLAGIVAVDKGRSSELTQAKARLLQAQALKDAAKAKAREAEITLLKLVGKMPIPIPSGAEWNIKSVNLPQLISAAHSHPTLRKASAEADAADLRAEAIRSSTLPQLNWVVGKNTTEDELGNQQAWHTSLNMSWAAFRGGSTRASERAALSRASASRHEAAQQLRDLEFRIRTAENDARTQLERAQLYKELSVESDRIRDAFYQQWYHLGKRSLLDVLTAESDHYGNQVNEINNRFDGYQSIIRQYSSAGTLTGWLREEKSNQF